MPTPLHIVLYEPEIPPNTGNLIRLSANTGCSLHLVEPLGFRLDEKSLRRAGLDYASIAHVAVYPSLSAVREVLSGQWYAFSTKAQRSYDQARYQNGDVLLFGPETRGLPASVLDEFAAEHKLKLPMAAGGRSLNLSNAAAIACYEAWRQMDFIGAD